MLTSQFLIDEKVCCGRGCRMCPYEPRHIKGNTDLQKRWDMSQKLSYNIAMNKIGIPMIGLGTWLIPNDEVAQVSSDALELGYQHIDTAQVYRNEEGIGKALTASSTPRDKIFITTKMWPGMFGQEEPFQNFKGAISACDESLKLLQVDEIDLYLIHNPFAKENRLEQWEAMIELKKQGKVKNIGVSNYNVKHIQEIEMAGVEMPVANQIEIHPWHVVRTELAQYMDKHEILPIAYSSLAPIPNWREGSQWNGKPEDMKSGAIPCQNIADQYEVTVPQLFLKWAIQLGYPVLPKSVHYNRLKENLDLDHFTISRDDVKVISKIAKDNQKCLAWSGDFDPIDVD
jgi:2,5-diketo-D-gluconate reductase A